MGIGLTWIYNIRDYSKPRGRQQRPTVDKTGGGGGDGGDGGGVAGVGAGAGGDTFDVDRSGVAIGLLLALLALLATYFPTLSSAWRAGLVEPILWPLLLVG